MVTEGNMLFPQGLALQGAAQRLRRNSDVGQDTRQDHQNAPTEAIFNFLVAPATTFCQNPLKTAPFFHQQIPRTAWTWPSIPSSSSTTATTYFSLASGGGIGEPTRTLLMCSNPALNNYNKISFRQHSIPGFPIQATHRSETDGAGSETARCAASMVR